MKKLLPHLLLVLFVVGLYATDIKSNKKWNTSVSYGFLSEKTPISLLEFSKLLNIDKHSELYITFATMIFGTGVGSGYKYYFKNISSSSIFINFGSFISYLGTADEGMTAYGLNISPGYCILQNNKTFSYRETFGGELKYKKYKKSSLNVGLSFVFMGDKSGGFIPFISWEQIF